MDTTDRYLNYALWALGLMCLAGIIVALLVSR